MQFYSADDGETETAWRRTMDEKEKRQLLEELTGKREKTKYEKDPEKLIRLLKNENAFVCTSREVRTIATFYYSIFSGGAEKVLVLLANMWIDMGYRVIVMTETEPTPDDYKLDSRITRIVIPPYNRRGKSYRERAGAIEKAILDYHIDTMVYHAWEDRELLAWDMLFCKLYDVRFIIYTHSVFAKLMLSADRKILQLHEIYSLVDAVITLSDVDLKYWSSANQNVFRTVNPVDVKTGAEAHSKKNKNIIVWIGRFSTEKRPEEAIEIIRQVVYEIPDVKLYMLGEVPELQLCGFKQMIEQYNLLDNIIITGYLGDLSRYLSQASLLLSTSVYEGFPLSVLEGLAYGLPCVMYELPYLSVVDENEAVISVAQMDAGEAAKQITALLKDEGRRQYLSSRAKMYAERFIDFDQKSQWNEVFASLHRPEKKRKRDTESLMISTLLQFYIAGIEKRFECQNEIELKKIIPNMLHKKIAYFGTGIRCRRYMKEHPEIEICFCIDNDINKRNEKIGGVSILYFGDVETWDNLFIIITPVDAAAICRQLACIGLEYGRDFACGKDIF